LISRTCGEAVLLLRANSVPSSDRNLPYLLPQLLLTGCTDGQHTFPLICFKRFFFCEGNGAQRDWDVLLVFCDCDQSDKQPTQQWTSVCPVSCILSTSWNTMYTRKVIFFWRHQRRKTKLTRESNKTTVRRTWEPLTTQLSGEQRCYNENTS